MVKRIYFWKDGTCFQYDPRPTADRVVKVATTAARFKGLNADFAAHIDAALNRGDGLICLFRGDECWDYDALKDQVVTPRPRKISDAWPGFPRDFSSGIDAAFNSGTGKAYFFKKHRYLRYRLADTRVDDPDPGTANYPRAIADPNGWRGLTPEFEAGIDAAVYAGDDKIYFFKGDQYARLSFSSRSVDAIDPPYPRKIASGWNGLPAQISAAVEWIQAGTGTLTITRAGCVSTRPDILNGVLAHSFTIEAQFRSPGYPSLCGCAEYRQFVRGSVRVGGLPVLTRLANPAGGAPVPLLDRPPSGSADDHFREDGRLNETPAFYGHRNAPVDINATYDQPDQRSGCHYKGTDVPFASGRQGQLADMRLDFRGLLIDVAADDEVLDKQEWTIFCSRTL